MKTSTDIRTALKRVLTGSITGEQATQELRHSKRISSPFMGVYWGNGRYSLRMQGPELTEAQVLEQAGLDSLEELPLIAFAD